MRVWRRVRTVEINTDALSPHGRIDEFFMNQEHLYGPQTVVKNKNIKKYSEFIGRSCDMNDNDFTWEHIVFCF